MLYRITIFLLFASPLFAQFRTSMPERRPAQITVREFIRQDYLGARLDAATWAKLKPLTNWKDNPKWKEFRIVDRYEVVGNGESGHNAKSIVQYQVLGYFQEGIGYDELNSSQDVEFRLKEIDGEWKIDSTDDDRFEPHISRQRAIQWLQAELPNAKNVEDKASIEQALRHLQKPSASMR